MKIPIMTGAFFPVPPILGGAVEKAWFALAREFVRRSHEVVQISRAHPQLPAREEIAGAVGGAARSDGAGLRADCFRPLFVITLRTMSRGFVFDHRARNRRKIWRNGLRRCSVWTVRKS